MEDLSDVKQQRMFIGNLPSDVKLNHLISVLPPGFDELKLEIKHNYDIDKNITSTYAFVNIRGNTSDIKSWRDSASKKSVGGNVLDVQFAKLSFLERLKQEVDSQRTQKNDIKSYSLPSKVNIAQPNISKTKKFFKEQSPSFDFDVESETKLELEDDATDDEGDSKNIKAEVKRLESLKERSSAHVNQQKIIKMAIKTMSHGPSNKIIFQDSDDENDDNLEAQDGDSKKRKLFDDSDAEEANDNIEFSTFKPKTKLIRTKISVSDERFRMDSKFFDDKETALAPDPNTDDQEKKNIMKIVDSIIQEDPKGKPLKPKNHKEKNAISITTRFDPLEKKHSSLIIKKDEEIECLKEKKQVKLKPFKVTNDRFYDVSDDLKNQFKESDKTGFSLLGLFSGGSNEVSKSEGVFTNDITKDKEDEKVSISGQPNKNKKILNPITKGVPNFFNIENDSEDDGEKESTINKSETTEATWHEPLFISLTDPRVQEALQFFNSPPMDNVPHAVISSNLRKIVKKKHHKNLTKTRMFKTKLGSQRKFQKGNMKKKKITEIAPSIK